MLADAYPYRYIMDEAVGKDGHLRNSLYKFRSSKSRLWYIVLVEHYSYDVYAVKFYLKANRNSKDRYRLMTNTFEPRRIINTCINIMLAIYAGNPKASFGFVGANGFGESEAETKRYRVYSTMVATYFSDQVFLHKENKKKSAYLLINRQMLEQDPTLTDKIEQYFGAQYAYFEQ